MNARDMTRWVQDEIVYTLNERIKRSATDAGDTRATAEQRRFHAQLQAALALLGQRIENGLLDTLAADAYTPDQLEGVACIRCGGEFGEGWPELVGDGPEGPLRAHATSDECKGAAR